MTEQTGTCRLRYSHRIHKKFIRLQGPGPFKDPWFHGESSGSYVREVLQVSDGGGWYLLLLLLLCSYLAIVLHNREERRSALPSLLVGRSGRVMLAGCPGWPGWPGSLDYLPGAGSVQGMMGPALSVRWRHSVSTPGPVYRPQ